jgi:beta-N-acetylhexosaminidase
MNDGSAASPVWITLDGAEPGPQVQAFLREIRPYGVILFSRHLRSRSQTAELCQCVREAFPAAPPKIALDQEGGRVSRLAALGYRFPGAEELAGDPASVERVAWEMGEVLTGLGFDVDFAPVADLGPAAPGTGLEGRLYGDDPGRVARCCGAFLDGLERAGILGCLKHFPGLGGSRADSHRELPILRGGRSEREAHLEPFSHLAGRVPYVMTAHGAYEFLGEPGPSSLLPPTYRLLGETGFTGLSVTDDLCMGAVANLAPLHELAARALGAGASLALWVGAQEATLRAVERLRERQDFVVKLGSLE